MCAGVDPHDELERRAGFGEETSDVGIAKALSQRRLVLRTLVDLHNRAAHIGISLRPAFRGRGLGVDVVRVLCRYGFAVRGLHRLQVETVAANIAMIQAASRAGFTREGTLRRSAWANGDFTDEAVLGLLAAEWKAA